MLIVNLNEETKEGDQICSFQQYQDGLYCNFFFIHNRLKMESVIPVGEKGECSEPPNVIGMHQLILLISLNGRKFMLNHVFYCFFPQP